ncbi:MAG: hypothetical protein IJ249_02255 [Paludibacteraceae bacterium]|nr:hypothetical protein [Paludibacteraceae bacterium]
MQGERDFFANKNVLLQKIFAQIFGYVQKMLYLCSRKVAKINNKEDETMCMYNLTLNDELVQRTRRSFANETDMTAWLQRQVEALLIEYNTAQQTVRRNARAAIATMRRQSELNGNSEMTLEDINNEILQARQVRKTAAQ